VPHWQGVAPGPPRELSEEGSALRQAVADRDPAQARRCLSAQRALGRAPAQPLLAYPRTGPALLWPLPPMPFILVASVLA